MKYHIYNIDESKPLQQGDPHAPQWPFRMLLAGVLVQEKQIC